MCVLVVENEPLVRAVAVEALETEGFEVIAAPSADYAVTLLQSRDDIDVVFTDVAMPGTLNGFDLARLVRGRTRTSTCWSTRAPCRWGSAGRRRRPVSCASLTASRRSRRSSAG
jgi:CheY-like chemotaxis protein